LHLSWDVPYEPGVLKAVGYKNRQKVCEEEIRTTDDPARIVLESDRDSLRADARDVAHITVKLVDAHGVVVPTATNLVTFEVQGSGSLLGVDNGDPVSHEDYKAPQRKAFAGLCLALLQSGRAPGRLQLTARAIGLDSATIDLTVNSAPQQTAELP
jgi:beta-galactosidase